MSTVTRVATEIGEVKKLVESIKEPALEEESAQEVQTAKVQKSAKRGMQQQLTSIRQLPKPADYLAQECCKTSFTQPPRETREAQRRCAKAVLSTPVDIFRSDWDWEAAAKKPEHLADSMRSGDETIIFTTENDGKFTYGGFLDEDLAIITQKAFDRLKSDNPPMAFYPKVGHSDVLILGKSQQTPEYVCDQFWSALSQSRAVITGESSAVVDSQPFP